MLPPSLTPPTLSFGGSGREHEIHTSQNRAREERCEREKALEGVKKRATERQRERVLTNKREPVHAKAPRSMLQFFLSFSPSALSCLYFPLVLPSELFLEGGEPRK